MATQEIALNTGWSAIAGPGAVTVTIENAGYFRDHIGWAEAPTTPTGLIRGGHGFRDSTESFNVASGSNLYINVAKAGAVVTVTRTAAPV